MGLGGYLAAKGDAEHYASERVREQTEVIEKPEAEEKEVSDVFYEYGLTKEESDYVESVIRPMEPAETTDDE